MPIVTDESHPKRRRVHAWLLALGLAALVPVGVFASSWYRSLGFDLGPGRLVFGASYGNVSTLGYGWHRFPNGWELTLELPRRSGLYDVTYIEPRNGR